MAMKTIEIEWIDTSESVFFDKMALFQKKNPQKVCQFQKKHYLCIRIQGNASENAEFFAEYAEIAQLVEHNLAKVGVAGPSPVFRSHLEQKEALEIGFNVKMPRWRNW